MTRCMIFLLALALSPAVAAMEQQAPRANSAAGKPAGQRDQAGKSPKPDAGKQQARPPHVEPDRKSLGLGCASGED